MTKRWTVLLMAVVLAIAACSGGAASPTPGGTTSATGTPAGSASPSATTGASGSAGATGSASPAASETAGASPTATPAAVCAAPPAAASPAPAGPSFDPGAITGTADVGHWNSTPAENTAVDCLMKGFAATYPSVQATNDVISDPYNDNMVTRFGAHNPPDTFYLNGDIALDWEAQGFLAPLDDYIANQGIDMTKFFPGYQDTFKGLDGKTYGIAKDGNTIAMAYNTDLVPTPPTTMEELITVATGLQGQTGLTAPMCLSPGLDRGLAFMYAQGGSLLTEDNSAEAISTDASKASVQWYMDLFKNGLGLPPPAKSWCGEQLGKQAAAIVFEGGWLLGYMRDTYPDVHWAFAELPVGSIDEPVTISYTAAWAMGADSVNKDQGWTFMQYATGPDGMAVWTSGGIAIPSRSDVPAPAGFETIVKGAAYSKPGSGFMPHYNDVQKAFQDAFTLEVSNATYSADPVVSATSAAITTALQP
jgi:multiple sugar transport system substrate-binding protein